MNTEDDSQFDARLSQALQNAPLPSGLRERLLTSLESERASLTQSPGDAPLGLSTPAGMGALESSASPHNRHRSLAYRGWSSRAALGIVAVIALVAIGLVVMRAPRRIDQLASYCISELQQNNGQAEWTMEQPVISNEIRRLSVQHRLSFAGHRSLSDNRFGNPCAMWRLQQPNQQVLFVFEFEAPVPMDELSNRMRRIQGPDSSWSFAAAHFGDRMLLIATRGDINPFVETGIFA